MYRLAPLLPALNRWRRRPCGALNGRGRAASTGVKRVSATALSLKKKKEKLPDDRRSLIFAGSAKEVCRQYLEPYEARRMKAGLSLAGPYQRTFKKESDACPPKTRTRGRLFLDRERNLSPKTQPEQ